MPSRHRHAVARYRLLLSAVCTLSSLLLVSACRPGGLGATTEAPTVEELVAYYSPRSIKILPFTKPRSFDDDAVPDGIGVSLRTLDAAGDPVKAYGTFMFELYAYRPAIGPHRGQLLQTWTQHVRNIEEQKKFWERVTATYEFQLSWEGNPIPPQQKYILAASFQATGSPRLDDDYEFDFHVQREEIKNAVSQQK